MSINDFTNKIKNKLDIDTFTIMCLFIIVGVGIGSFGLGRLSVLNNRNNQNDEVKIVDTRDQQASVAKIDSNSIINNTIEDNINEKKYVASKNGKLYYSIGCSGAKRIAEKNKIWFANESDAKKAGYEFSSSCK